MPDLAEFLLARFADDEDAASYTHHTAPFECNIVFHASVDPTFGWECNCGVPPRVLAECVAKRRIIRDLTDAWTVESYWTEDTRRLAECVLRHLAAPYADHPDYREEWRP